jgi:Predicted metal-dependent enzyme
MGRPVQYGGQAVIEGVMMRGPRESAIAVRLPNGEIEVTRVGLNTWAAKPVFKLPLIRGFVALVDSLIVGTKALTFSANRSMGEEGEEVEELGFWEMALTIGFAFGLGLLLFVGLPTAMAHLLQGKVTGVVVQNLLEGLIRLIVFFLYILLISRLKDIQRVFQYHGAEHKAIFAYEAGKELTVENTRPFSRLHPRCGTSFLLIVVVVSIFVFAFVGLHPLWWRIVSRILLMPVVAGLAYEILKFSARHLESPWFRWLIVPGLLLQKLTTREPDDAQLEVSLAALKGVLDSGQELT